MNLRSGIVRILILPMLLMLTISGCANKKPDGKQLYTTHCLQCHQSDGLGVPGMFPPLAGTSITKWPKENVISLLIYGFRGPLEVEGKSYYQDMPAFGYLKDEEIVAILNYVRNHWGNKAPRISLKDVADVRFRKYDINLSD
jgi:mono/diheme cytochrome c family protein